jgi:hypothetical protein
LWLYIKKTIRILTKTSLKLKPQKGSMFDWQHNYYVYMMCSSTYSLHNFIWVKYVLLFLQISSFIDMKQTSWRFFSIKQKETNPGLCCSFCQITYLNVFSSLLWCWLWILCINNVRFIFTVIYFLGNSCFIYVICIYLCILASNRISTSDNSNTTSVTSGSETAYPSGVPEFIPSSCFVGFMLLHLHFSVLCFVDHFVFFLLTMYCLYFFNFRCGLSLWYLQTFLNTHFCS